VSEIADDVQIELKRLENEMRTKKVEADTESAEIDAWKAIGVRLRSARRAKRMTQTSLAESIGVTHQQIAKYEKGRGRLPLTRAVKLCDTLGCSLEWLARGDGLPGG